MSYVMFYEEPEKRRTQQQQQKQAPAAAKPGAAVESVEDSEDVRLAMRAHRRFTREDDRLFLDDCIIRLDRVRRRGRAVDPALLNNLGVALLDRFRLDGRAADLDLACRILEQGYRMAEPGSRVHARILTHLAQARREDLNPALQRQVAETPGVPIVIRIRAARDSGRAAANDHGPAAGFPLLDTAVGLLPSALIGAREQMLQILADFPGLAGEAAAAAISAGDLPRAVELLDNGRAMLWWQHMHSREARDVVAETYPDVAAELERTAAALKPQPYTPGGDDRMIFAPADERADRANPLDVLTMRYAELAGRTPLSNLGVADMPYDDLREAAREGPVVYVNVSPWRCDALIVRADRTLPDLVPLPRLTATAVDRQARRYLEAMTHGTGRAREDQVAGILAWLWRAVGEPVLAGLPQPRPNRRIWWVPTGALTTLPLHAAGAVLDEAVSSYTPTLRDLLRARSSRVRARDPRLLLVMPQPSELPGAARTRALLDNLFQAPPATVRAGPEATLNQVLQDLTDHSWVHFDCHAVQDLRNPLLSRLTLHDQPLTIAALADLPATQAEFAFLAACATAAGGDQVYDEWISLTAALMNAGFPAVVGTLWPVADAPTARITKRIYEHIIVGQIVVHTLSAAALHQAALTERHESPNHPSTWVSFVHYGL
ncbi:hypothetical protein GCM10010435_83790 [Winogradskya consettensis]|uniref:CHAT domain-containing protein n=1 Tax=Winogradskya consettensis TaxID=113560 RepID=A0A919W0S0_9ACTN|nr:CHAT domain-containing protein [Actinoplanes consettensis]GIM82184.1 hypothetical protein Aco04nite_80310 [Actinoplanes consettensis]